MFCYIKNQSRDSPESYLENPKLAEVMFAGFELQPPRDGKGTKTCNLTNQQGKDLTINLGAAKCLFEPSAFSGAENASRVTLSVELEDSIKLEIERLDAFLLSAVMRLRLFGDTPQDVVSARYQSACKHPQGYAPYLKLKMNLAGKEQVRVWDTEHKLREPPVLWRGVVLRVAMRVRSVYVTGSTWGAVLEATDVLVVGEQQPKPCPWAEV